LGWSDIADDPILFESTSKNIPALYSQPISLRTLFERHLDIFGRPRRYFFQLLSFFATNEQHAEKLVEFGTTEGQTDLYAYAHKPRRTIFEVLQDFTSVKIPIKYLPDLIPPMRPRQFSISSCKQVHGDSIHLAVAIVHYKSSLQEPRVGVCTDWMKTLRSGGTFISLDLVDFDIQKGTFKLPNPLYPIICIGPGTGIAPMRSLLYHHFTYSAQPSCLLFGGRNVDADYYFEKEWKKASELYPFKVITAFSRDQEDKIYVQHRIVEHGAYLWNLIEQGAVIYLSGYFKLTRNAKRMPVDVQEAFVQVFIKHGHLSQDQANEFIKTLKNSNRFQEECWS
jgi:sulfite reductase alpha subunit-like flavoprotein